MRSSYLEEERASVNGEKGENADFAGKTFPGGGIPAENLSEPLRFPYLLRYAGPACSDK